MPEYIDGIKYPTPEDRYNTNYGEPEWWRDLATTVASAVASSAQHEWWRGSSELTTSADDLSLAAGTYTVWSTSQAPNLGLPTRTQGVLEVFRYGAAGAVQRWSTRSIDFPLEVWQRQHFNTYWDDWVRIDAGAVKTPIGGSGFKILPLAVTLGNNGASDAPRSQTVRYALHFNAPVTRWRVHVANRNARNGATRAGNIDFSAWQLGGEGAGGAIESPQTVIPQFSTDGTGWVSRWLTAPISTGEPMLLGTSYTAAQAPILQVGACWSGTTEQSLTRQTTAPFEVWIEAETPATTPATAVLGSSSDAGVGGSRPVVDSVLARWARKHGALPVHYAHSGDAMSASLDPSAHKWARWAHLDRPDSVLFALGSNDVYGSGTVTEMQDRHALVAGIAAKIISPVQYGATVYQRANGEDPDRIPYNTWLKGMPNGLRDVFDFAAAIGSPPDPAFDADGVHLNDAGQTALLASIDHPLTSPAPAGHLTARLAALEYDTGWRDITPLAELPISSGRILLRRTGKDVKVRLDGLHLSSGTSGTLATLPTGFRPVITESNTVRGLSQQAQLSRYGNLQLYYYQPDVRIEGGLVATTDQSPPTSLPGNPA